MKLRPPEQCRYDLVSLGEVMLRLDPGEGRIATTRTFTVHEGGGEYNVARGLRYCFGLRTAVVTALADNPVGRLIEGLILHSGVDLTYLSWVPYDGVGRQVRNGLNFVERGFGVRAALGCSDRGLSAASLMRPGDVDWEELFARQGARWFHCGGIFAALGEGTAALALEAMSVARRHGTAVSFDLNYRPSLWKAFGGREAAAAVNRPLVELADVLFGNEEDFSAGLGYGDFGEIDVEVYKELHRRVLDDFPRVEIVATTLREAHSATVNGWSGICSTRESCLVGPSFPRLEILDRVGGGDSFASGLAYGLLEGLGLERALAYGVAHGALAMTTPGDTSMATRSDVDRLVAGTAARVER